jgi:hypothetical protein
MRGLVFSLVIAGLDPAIHPAVPKRKSIMDHRVTPLGCCATCADGPVMTNRQEWLL